MKEKRLCVTVTLSSLTVSSVTPPSSAVRLLRRAWRDATVAGSGRLMVYPGVYTLAYTTWVYTWHIPPWVYWAIHTILGILGYTHHPGYTRLYIHHPGYTRLYIHHPGYTFRVMRGLPPGYTFRVMRGLPTKRASQPPREEGKPLRREPLSFLG